ncbi:DEAD/DEAH box helicase [Mycobacterium sp. SMC-4]|uniref:SNF2-related protein n=1 Tax=Mycobacterium sp. SMC-4 TaxID=2857059 RepID=UPI0021B1AE84|nr:DEAD/DEAH box helicase [Mycobacterium sp. SMC-4]UXA19512.1 DEAD/DEAH box helicase [Mycobacterium sp. SMC-4]
MKRVAGTIDYGSTGTRRAWRIIAEPDIMIRLKRLIPGVKHSAAALFVSDTEEMAQELEWILHRWEFVMTDEARALLAQRAAAAAAREELVQGVLAGTRTPRGQEWIESALPLRDYQRTATDLVHATGSTLVVDELGLGKTLMSLALLENPARRPGVAVTLTGLGGQWLRELRKFYPTLRGHEVRSTKVEKELPRLLSDGQLDVDLILLNYAKLWAWGPVLADHVNTVIFDEIQELRRAESLKYEGAQALISKGAVTAGLSATPIYNFGGEMYSVMNILRPGCLGTREEFLREWAGGWSNDHNGKVRVRNPEALRAHLKSQGLFLRRTREDVGIELPAIETIEQQVPSDQKRLSELSGNAVEMARLILSQDATNSQKWQSAGELDWRLRQATGVSKAPFVADFVRLLLESQDKVLLFGWHRDVYSIWMERLREHRPVLYSGTESPKQKAEAFERFTKGDSRVLIMSLRSGAGLDGLQDVCSTLVFGELDWSPGVHRQAIGRLGRPGQKHGVLAYFCVTNDGSDPVILDTLNIKRMESDRLIEPEVGTVATATPAQSHQHIKRLAAALIERTEKSA